MLWSLITTLGGSRLDEFCLLKIDGGLDGGQSEVVGLSAHEPGDEWSWLCVGDSREVSSGCGDCD